MKLSKIYSSTPDVKEILRIVKIIEEGGVVILPTDTLYAFCCDTLNTKAIERICAIKKINPAKANLSIIGNNIALISEYVKINNTVFRLLKEHLPGPFTFILSAGSNLPKVFRSRRTVGIRVPDHPLLVAVVSYLGRPLMCSTIPDDLDEDYMINAELIEEKFRHQIDWVLDAGDGGLIPSTVIDCTDDLPIVIREGMGRFEI